LKSKSTFTGIIMCWYSSTQFRILLQYHRIVTSVSLLRTILITRERGVLSVIRLRLSEQQTSLLFLERHLEIISSCAAT